jgi:hypothetical protein
MTEELGSDTWYTAIVDGQTFRGKAVQYADVNGWAMFEGDICLGRTEDVRRATEARQADEAGNVAFGVVITGQQFRWPDGVVPYEIDPAMPNQNRVTDAIAHWQANTAIRFVQRTPQNSGQFANYVRFFEGDGCWSEVGMQGNGQQHVSLGPSCTTGNAIHEIGHSVGLWHEQSREDRDSFVQIIWANIDPSKVHNFDQHITDGDDVGAYDYGSIMHYQRRAFSINDQDTIVPLQAGAQIGQRDGLSEGDKAAVRLIYPARLVKKVVDEPPKNIKKLVDDPQHKKNLDDPPHLKKVFDEPPVNIKKLVDDPQFKKVVDDHRQIPVPVPGPGPVSPGATPFLLATPHHAAVGGQDPDLSAQLSQLDGLVAAAQAKLAALQSAVDAAAAELTAMLQARAQLLGG